MANTRGNVRVGGVYTQFQWDGKVIGWARGVRDEGPRPVAPPVAIQPMDAPYPLDIVTPGAIGPGTLQVRIFEKFGSRVWDEMMAAIAGVDQGPYNDIRQVFVALSAMDRPINAIKVINPPRLTNQQQGPYGDVYLNCKITDMGDTEDVEIETMTIVKNITITYTRKIRTDSGLYSSSAQGGIARGSLTNVRDSALPVSF